MYEIVVLRRLHLFIVDIFWVKVKEFGKFPTTKNNLIFETKK